jgi:outer membrane protein OmpA-like peptidoglycan-associated protein
MPTIFRIIILSFIVLLTACSHFRLDEKTAFITTASYRSEPEPPIVAARLLLEPLPELPSTAPLSVEPSKPVIPNIVENILFDSDSSTLTPLAMTQLDNFAITTGGGTYQILVEGHTDSTHHHDYNHALSEARAAVVREALIARGITPERLITKYHGETKAVATNNYSVGKQQNRRVELRVIKPTNDTSLKSFAPLQATPQRQRVEIVDVQLQAPKKLEIEINAPQPKLNINPY